MLAKVVQAQAFEWRILVNVPSPVFVSSLFSCISSLEIHQFGSAHPQLRERPSSIPPSEAKLVCDGLLLCVRLASPNRVRALFSFGGSETY